MTFCNRVRNPRPVCSFSTPCESFRDAASAARHPRRGRAGAGGASRDLARAHRRQRRRRRRAGHVPFVTPIDAHPEAQLALQGSFIQDGMVIRNFRYPDPRGAAAEAAPRCRRSREGTADIDVRLIQTIEEGEPPLLLVRTAASFTVTKTGKPYVAERGGRRGGGVRGRRRAGDASARCASARRSATSRRTSSSSTSTSSRR